MTRHPSPYHPGFNQPPAVLAGHERLLTDIDEALEIAGQSTLFAVVRIGKNFRPMGAIRADTRGLRG